MEQKIKNSFERWKAILFDAETEQPFCAIYFDDEKAAKNVAFYLQECGDITMEILEKVGIGTSIKLRSQSFEENNLPSLNIPDDIIPNMQSFVQKVPFDKSFPLVPMIEHNNQSVKLSPLSDYIVPVISYTYRKVFEAPYPLSNN